MTHPFWRQVVLSFSSGGFYRDILHQPFSRSLRYLALLVLTASLFLSARYAVALYRFLGEAEGWVQNHLLEIRIEQGEVKSPVSQPWRYSEKDRFTAILDTTGKIQEIPSEFQSGLLLTRRYLLYQRGPFESRRYDLSKVDSFLFNAQTVRDLREKGKWFFWPILFGCVFVYLMIAKCSQLILFSAFSFVTSRIAERPLPYHALLNIGVYAMTLPFLLGAGVLLWVYPIPFFGLVFVAVYGALLVTAVLHTAPPRQAPEEASP